MPGCGSRNHHASGRLPTGRPADDVALLRGVKGARTGWMGGGGKRRGRGGKKRRRKEAGGREEEMKGGWREGGGGGGVGRVLRGGSRLPLRLASRVTCRSVLVLHGARARDCPQSLARLQGGTGWERAAARVRRARRRGTARRVRGEGGGGGVTAGGCGGGRCATAPVRVRLAQRADGVVCKWSDTVRGDVVREARVGPSVGEEGRWSHSSFMLSVWLLVSCIAVAPC